MFGSMKSKKWCNIDTLLLHTTNKKHHMACRFVPFPVTLNDVEGHSPVTGLFTRNSTNIFATFCTASTDTMRYTVRRRQLSLLFCYN